MPRLTIVAALLLAAPCAPLPAQNKAAKHDRSIIAADEIAAAQVSNAYDAVARLRPYFLRRGERAITAGGSNRPRGEQMYSDGDPTSGSSDNVGVRVLVDGNDVGGPEELKRMAANTVGEIRYISGPDAEQRYGSRFAAGAIEVRFK
ncbi:MAG TPA: hypothetical protein VFW66_05030 [Gemmatimonadales bacterium]|nr:hypothetical protein [Gemmatimonadales bacterium]